jgi:hypothetical protein
MIPTSYKPIPMWKKILYAIGILISLAASTWALTWYQGKLQQSIDKKTDEVKTLSFQMEILASKLFKTTITRDSALQENRLLSKYRALTDAMSYRDSIRKPFSFRKGDIVRLKRDSTLVVVEDLIVGGGQYDYYIKYIIEHKDKSLETVSPEKIYK